MQDRFLFLGFIFVCAVIGSLIFQGVALVICRWAKLEVLEFRLFYGRPISKRMIGDTEFALGWIPTGGYVRYDLEAHAKLPLGWRLFLLFGSFLSVAVAAICVLGWQEFQHQVWTGIFQIIEGALHPLTVGPALMAKGQEAVRNSILLAVGLVWAKQTALMLLPAGVLPGGKWLVEIFDSAQKHRMTELLVTASALIIIALHISWCVAMLRYALYGA